MLHHTKQSLIIYASILATNGQDTN